MVKKRKRVPKVETTFNDQHNSTSTTTLNKNTNTTTIQSHPYRNLDSLYTSTRTFQCAIGSSSSSSSSLTSPPCIPCAYKIATFDTSLDYEFTQTVRNVRPEMCPRSKEIRGIKGTYGYSNTKTNINNNNNKRRTKNTFNILTIGDGDFTFTLALARMLLLDNCDNNINSTEKNSISIVATSYESKSTLEKVYPSIDKTITELSKFKQVRIAYQVDATRLSETLPSDIIHMNTNTNNNPNHDSATVTPTIHFHRIIWNFPCTAESNGQDGQNKEMEENKMLIQKFVQNCVPFMKIDDSISTCDDGNSEIHMIHKTKPPYDQWKIEQVALEGWCNHGDDDGDSDKDDMNNVVTSSTSSCPLEYKGRIVFDKCLLPPYTPRKALDKKSFPCHDACIYIIGLKKKNRKIEYNGKGTTKGGDDNSKGAMEDDDRCRILSTIPESINDNENIDYDEIGDDTNRGIIPVTKGMIDKIRNTHLLNAKYGHGHGERKMKKKRKKRR